MSQSQTSLKTFLTILENSALFTSRPAFRLPQVAKATGKVECWDVITYEQFYNDVCRVAKHWFNTLNSTANVSPRAVVAVWLSGWSYSDLVQIYGLLRAGYIPQLCSLRLPNPKAVFELLQKMDAQALIYEPSFGANMEGCPVPLYQPAQLDSFSSDIDDEPLATLTPVVKEDDIELIAHTSGSTSGIPKPVPYSYKWIDNTARKVAKILKGKNSNRPVVNTWAGSTCHMGQMYEFMGAFQHGTCTVLPSQRVFSTEELADMVDRCGLNSFTQFTTYLAIHLRNSCSDQKLLHLLQSFDRIAYMGLDLGKIEQNWAHNNGVVLRNGFGSTECSYTMISAEEQGSDPSILHPLSMEDTSYTFVPVDSASFGLDPDITGTVSELVVLSSSADCPYQALRSSTDGHFHTGDLFEEVAPGSYVYRGRDDDWIKSESAHRCDTKSIEDNVRSVCGDLIANCVVVGHRRPSPALFVEPASDDIDSETLKTEIYQRTQEFHARRYVHERIASVDMILVVERGVLPRTATKGNIRRRAVEEAFKERLDEAYSKLMSSRPN